MKNLRTIHIAMLLLFGCLSIYGQKTYLDSICVQIDDDVELNMSVYKYSNITELVEKDLVRLQTILRDSGNVPSKTSYSIFYEPDKLLSIKQAKPIEKIIWINDNQTRYQFNNQCDVESANYHLQIKFNELETLVSENVIVKIMAALDSTQAVQNRYSTVYNYSFKGESMVHSSQMDKDVGQMDVILLKGGVGVNLVKNQPVIDLSAEIGFAFNKKGLLKNQYYVAYSQLSDFNADSKIELNSFISIGYRYNLSKVYKDAEWLGVEIGYLVSQQGDMFNENTFRLGVNWELGKYMSVAPQIYFSGEQIYPALRIGFGF